MSWLSSILGIDAQHNLGVATRNNQAVQNKVLSTADQQQQQANMYTGNAATGYQGFTSAGQNDAGNAYSALLNLLSQYGTTTGVNTADVVNALGQQPQNGNNRTTPHAAGTTSLPPGVQGPVNNPSALPVGQQQAQAGVQNPYNLMPAQQQQLNQQTDRINASKQAAIAQYRSDAAQRGVQPLPAAEQYIAENFDRQINELHANFAEQARAAQQQAQQQLIDLVTGLRNTGLQQQQFGISGTAGLGQNAQNQATGLLSSAAGNAQQQQQIAQQQADSSLGSFLNLIAYGLGGGFNIGGNKSTTTQSSTSSTGGLLT